MYQILTIIYGYQWSSGEHPFNFPWNSPWEHCQTKKPQHSSKPQNCILIDKRTKNRGTSCRKLGSQETRKRWALHGKALSLPWQHHLIYSREVSYAVFELCRQFIRYLASSFKWSQRPAFCFYWSQSNYWTYNLMMLECSVCRTNHCYWKWKWNKTSPIYG